MALSDANQCTAKSKSTGKRCKNPAIVGTNICRLHGGKGVRHGEDNPAYKTGTRVRYKEHLPERILAKAEQFSQGDPLDIFEELAIQRSLFADYASRFQAGIPMSLNDVSALMEFTTEIMRSVERIVKMRNETALTGAEINFLKARAVDVVRKYFDDPERQRQFIRDLFGLEEPSVDGPRRVELVGGTARGSGKR